MDSVFHVSFPGLGLEMEVNRVCMEVFGLKIYWYGVIIAFGMLLAFLYAYFNSKRLGVDFNKLIDCILVGVVTAIIGARLYYVIFRWDYFSQNPDHIFNINEGGLAIYGGIIGALAGGLTVAKIKKMKIMPILDITMLGFLIGQGIGRWGNFVNQEAFGTQTDSIFKMVSENTGNTGVHPCFLYESFWCLLGFVVLHIFSVKWQKYSGQVFYLYLVWYGAERMVVEGLRTDSLYLPFSIGGYTPRVSQVLSLIILITGIVLIVVNRNNTNKAVIIDKNIKTSEEKENVSDNN